MKSYRFIIVLLLSVVLFATDAAAAVKHRIEKITYSGNERITDETIYAYLELDRGDSFSNDKADESIKALFRTGFFSDIKVVFNNGVLNVKVVENPLISKIAFDGNKRLEDKDILDELSMQPNTVFSHSKMQNDIKRVISLYQKDGRYSAKVSPKIVKLDQNRIHLIYEIEEGSEAKIQKINFAGNHAFSDSELSEVIASREERWYRFFTSADIYNPDKLEYDKELLRRYYQNRGYADFKITSATSEISPGRDAFLLTFIIDEGEIYSFGKIEMQNDIKAIDAEALRPLIKVKEGKRFSKEKLDDSIDELTTYLGNHGYPFVEIFTDIKTNKETLTADVIFVIRESYKIYINKINIKNNTRTLDKVIRREFRIAEGDPYNISKIQRSKQRIENLGYFNKVEFKNKKTDFNDRMDIDVEVQEASTGSLNFAAGYNTTSGALGMISLSENNFLGTGQQVTLGVTQAQRESSYMFSFTEPYFNDKDLSLGFDVFSTRKDYEKQSSFNSKAVGFVLRAGYDITEHLSHGAHYTLKKERIYDVSENASPFVKGQEGTTVVSAIGHSLVYDRLDSRFEPTEGYLLKINQDVAGLGGQTRYLSHDGTAALFIPLYKKEYILKVIGRAGHIVGIGGKKVRVSDRYFIGPDYLRGFDVGGVGPRDKDTGDSLGGNTYYTGTTEVLFPVGLPNEVGLKGVVFHDFGSLFNIDESDKSKILSSKSIRASVGAGFLWKSPMGQMGIHYAVPYVKEKFDDQRRFYLTFGTKF